MAARPLEELTERDAPPPMQALYADIKACLGVPVINLIFRNMATIPGCLEFVWDAIRPLYVSGEAAKAQNELVSAILPGQSANWSQSDLLAIGLTAEETPAIAAVLQTYIRANPANMVGMLCLRQLLSDTWQPASTDALADRSFRPDPLPPLLPMIAPADMSSAAARAYDRLTEQLHGPGGTISPSLYRHFAPWPGLMSRIADETEDLVQTQLDDATEGMLTLANAQAASLARHLPAPVAPRPEASVVAHILDLATLFPPNMCKMTILAEYLRRGLRD